ncbi:B12-binding domain-containing radical SAM protein [uncultured Desulfobacter sp.]|uniref:B12-binding domain-containing radical SAM protein n=1 Tax=uncultured Desulfobacter sp. TaxID=240139 RepID=UPI0029F49D26|nr:radical SAM protein [uncultured Desulfobacter sp.]
MRILLINPPVPNIMRESLPEVVEEISSHCPPLGLLYIAAYIEDIPQCEVKILDCQAEKIDHDGLKIEISQFSPDIVGIQAMTFTLIDAIMVSVNAKNISQNTKVVLGGPHPTLYPIETVKIPSVDFVVFGEGEYPFRKFVQKMVEGKSADGIQGLISKSQIHFDMDINYIQDLDSLRRPAYHLINIENYSSVFSPDKRIMTMMSSRGCPGRCIFCDRPQMGKKFRKKSAKKVFDEMEYCVNQLGVNQIVFYDDTFTIDRQRVIDICDLIIDNCLNIKWDIRARIDNMNETMITKLAKAGCCRISFGIETGSDRLQNHIKKHVNLEKAANIVKFANNAGVEVLGYFMIGLPTEKREDVEKTIKYMMSLPIDYAHIAIFTPYPGTAFYNEMIKSSNEVDYWRSFAKSPSLDFQPKYWNEKFSDQELFRLLEKSYKRFYSRPIYILKRLFKIKSFQDLLHKTKLGLRILMIR